MAYASMVRRNLLFMHPAHATVGLSGGGTALGPYCRIERPAVSLPDALPHVPLRVAVTSRRLDADVSAAIALFEQLLATHCDIQLRRVELDAADAKSESADIDCVVLFHQGLHIARRRADLNLSSGADILVCPPSQGFSGRQECLPRPGQKELSRIEIAPAARRHPIIEGVTPFVSRAVLQSVCISPNATPLLIRRTAGEVQPVAWIERRRSGPVFHTKLGSSDDFRQPDFVRFVRNALVWIGR